MAKNKITELEYKMEGQKRMFARKKKRLAKFTKNREFRKKSTSCDCGGGGYCFCGSGKYGVIDY